jgi:hypothetical protein
MRVYHESFGTMAYTVHSELFGCVLAYITVRLARVPCEG